MEMQAGKYEAVTVSASVYEKEGKLLLAVEFSVSGRMLRNYSVLVAADGVVNTKVIDKLKAWSGWDGVEPFWFMENAPGGIPCEVEVELEPGQKDPTRLYPKIKWVNKSGGGSEMPPPADRNAVQAKYGAKFRAVAGPQKLSPRPSPVPVAVPVPSRAPAPPPRREAVPEWSQNTCWQLMQEKFGHLPQGGLEQKWFDFVDKTGMDQAGMTAEGWAQVAAMIHGDGEAGGDCPL